MIKLDITNIRSIKINSVDDVKAFFILLLPHNLVFHPDELFSDYISSKTKESLYTKDDSVFLDSLMDDAFSVCQAVDANLIYDIAFNVFHGRAMPADVEEFFSDSNQSTYRCSKKCTVQTVVGNADHVIEVKDTVIIIEVYLHKDEVHFLYVKGSITISCIYPTYFFALHFEAIK